MHRRKSRGAWGLILFSVIAGPVIAADVASDTGPQIPTVAKDQVRKRVEAGFAPGIILGVVNPEGRAFYTYGKADLESGQCMTPETIVEIGSVTKAFTSLLMVEAALDGRFKLESPIADYLPEGTKGTGRYGRQITFEDLAVHRSGLPRLPWNLLPTDPADPYAGYSCEQILEFMRTHQLVNPVRIRYDYSNFGLGLLGYLIERTTEKSFAQLIEQHITQPLSMQDTMVEVPEGKQSRFARGYVLKKPAPHWDFGCLVGTGGLRSTASDLLSFLEALLGLRSSELDEAISIALDRRYTFESPPVEMCLGWQIREEAGTEIYWHSGATGGFRSFAAFDRANQVGIVVLSNSAYDLDRLGGYLLEPTLGLPPVPTPVELPTAVLRKLVGYYELRSGAYMHITREEDQLFAQATGQKRFPIFPSSATEFYYTALDAYVIFERDDAGRIAFLTLRQPGSAQHAQRLPDDFEPAPVPPPVKLEDDTLDDYAGTYQLMADHSLVFYVKAKDDHLTLQLIGQERLPIVPIEKDVFFYPESRAKIIFRRNDSNEVVSLTVEGGGGQTNARKLD